ncbi:hypothetical protein V6N12_058968 [Hibiscus sabdariffa]|uniref:Uncharacterized protein n=1 Tax=Hibiscus sabdariffa TaxID=183260 RepID=A0ABR2ETS7_9ROSI
MASQPSGGRGSAPTQVNLSQKIAEIQRSPQVYERIPGLGVWCLTDRMIVPCMEAPWGLGESGNEVGLMTWLAAQKIQPS